MEKDEFQRKNKTKIILDVIVRISLFVVACYVHLLYIQHQKGNYFFFGTDFKVYQSIYQMNTSEWYLPSSWYYYSPGFYFLFYPFSFLSFQVFTIFGLIFYSIGFIRLMKRLDYSLWIALCLGICQSFLLTLWNGNIDIFLFGFLINLYETKISDKAKGFWLGICCFKGTIILVFFFFWAKSLNRKLFVIFFLLAVFFNYCYFLIEPSLIFVFLEHITMQSHPTGPKYLLGLQYSWLWGIAILFIQDYLQYLDYTKSRQSTNGLRRNFQSYIKSILHFHKF